MLEVFAPRAKDDTVKLPGSIAAFDSKIRVFTRMVKPIICMSVCCWRNLWEIYAIIASVCRSCASAVISVIGLENVVEAKIDSSRDGKWSAIGGYVVMQRSSAL